MRRSSIRARFRSSAWLPSVTTPPSAPFPERRADPQRIVAQEVGQMADPDLRCVRHHDAVLDHGAEFADVAGPVVVEEQLHRLGGELHGGFAVFLGEFLQEGIDEQAMSSFRVRSGGIAMETTLRRKNRSSRKVPSRTISLRSLFVAATTRRRP